MQTVHDEQGPYTLFVGRRCCADGCGVALTSRNRYGTKLLCLQHGRDHERERARHRYATGLRMTPKGALAGTTKATKTTSHAPGTLAIADPQWRKVYGPLNAWLIEPTSVEAAERLQAALIDHEMRYRLKALLPWVPSTRTDAPSIGRIPCEEPSFTNPEHRTTRLEFLADADHYGV